MRDFRKRTHICFVYDKKFLTANRKAVRQELTGLESCSISEINGWEGIPTSQPIDLLIVDGSELPADGVISWVERHLVDAPRNNEIIVPMILISHRPELEEHQNFGRCLRLNWYVDLLEPSHLSSLAIRTLNALKVHDQLHELRRMAELMNDLERRVDELEQK